MFNLLKGDLTQREVDKRLAHKPKPAERIASAIDEGEATAALSNRIKAITIRAILALGITATGLAVADQGIQKIDPSIMSMTPAELASKILHREVKE